MKDSQLLHRGLCELLHHAIINLDVIVIVAAIGFFISGK